MKEEEKIYFKCPKCKKIIERCNECKLKECINCEISWTEVQDIKKLYKAYKELEEENYNLKTHIFNPNVVKLNYIPKSKVEEKIEELKEEIEQLRIERNVTYDSGIYRNQIKIDILQELLEKR